jgi:N4-(beta-N-acetylglucosaminyl)-L-asparaginase
MEYWHSSLITLSLQFLFPLPTTAMTQPLVVNTWSFTAATHAAYLTLTSSSTSDPIDAVVAGCSKAEELQCDHTVGWGGSPDSNGETTLDALVMRGSDQKTGAVAGLRGIRDATKVARDVMLLTKHSLLAGDLARDFAVGLGYENEDLTSEYSRKLHEEWVSNGCVPNFWTDGRGCNGSAIGEKAMQNHFDEHNHDTIGQVALQADGRMAVGLSSNGARHRIAGRVGDAPLPGAGGYVDDDVGACIATGDGDVMMRHCPAFLGVELMRGGMTPQGAVDEAVRRIMRKSKEFSGAVVCVSKEGEHAAACHGFEGFSYSIQSGGESEKDVRVIKIQPLMMPAREQKVLMEYVSTEHIFLGSECLTSFETFEMPN